MSALYSPIVLEHFRRPRNRGSLPAPDIAHEALNPLCGDRVRVEAAVEGGAIRAARFRGDACALCVAAASLLTERVQGMPLEAAERMDPGLLVAALEAEIPSTRMRCALLPLQALQAGIREYPGRPEAE